MLSVMKRDRVVLSHFSRIAVQAELDGLFALPACADPSQKHPCIEWKDLQERRPTWEEQQEWERDFPHRNGVYLTGPLLGRFILDCDSREAAEWVAKQGVPTTQVVRTRKGWHLHFKYPNFRVCNSAGKIHPGVDVRGVGGVAVAVGSVHQSGFIYRWAAGRSPRDVPLAAAPAWLFDWLRADAAKREQVVHVEPRPFTGVVSAWARAAIDAELDLVRGAAEGTRNATLARSAYKLGQICGGGSAEKDAVRAALLNVAEAWPDELEKSRKTIESGLDAGMSHPRQRLISR